MVNSEILKKKLVLENSYGHVLRTFHWQGEDFSIVNRQDTRRLELHSELDFLNEQDVPYILLESVRAKDIANHPVNLEGLGQIRLVDDVAAMTKDVDESEERKRDFYLSLLLVFMLAVLLLSFVLSRKGTDENMEKASQQELVRIVNKVELKKQKMIEKPNITTNKDETITEKNKPVVKKENTIKRMGALAVLGSLKTGKQKGGIDLGAVNTTAGPGLGGTGGSGGMQTSLYGKGLVAAPVGPGAKMDGGGGYGTKGKGGGQAGYGKLSMVGSSGAQLIPVGTEATTEGGLDMGLISDVVRRNLGQIRFCYEQGLQGTPGLAGRVGVSFVISAEGSVSTANVASSTLNAKSVEDCIVMRVKSWRFPLPTNNASVKVTYPFVLNRAGQGAL